MKQATKNNGHEIAAGFFGQRANGIPETVSEKTKPIEKRSRPPEWVGTGYFDFINQDETGMIRNESNK